MRMRAYYYEFDPTGVDLVDRILSAVACAGKAFHHTEGWNEPIEFPYEPVFRGNTPRDWIQEAAKDAAAALAAERAAHAATRARVEQLESAVAGSPIVSRCVYCGHEARCATPEDTAAAILTHVQSCALRPESLAEASLARLDALLGEVMAFSISSTFDAKGTYTQRKSDEWAAIQAKLRAALDGEGAAPVLRGPSSPIVTTTSCLCGTCARPLP